MPATRITVRDRTIDIHQRPYIVAEMAAAHDGSLEHARTIIKAAVDASADAVQFEIFEPDANIIPSHEVHGVLSKLYFTRDEWKELFAFTRQFNIAISTFAYDPVGLEIGLENDTDIIKLNSSDLSNPEVVFPAAESGKPMMVWTGSSTMMEITKTVEAILARGNDQIVLMHGIQNFPTDFTKVHIRRVELLREAFGCMVGYGDHTDGDDPLSKMLDLLAVGMGAVVIEKHITFDRSARGIDYQSSLNPDEFGPWVETIHAAAKALGPHRLRTLEDHDYSYRRFQKKNIVAAHPIDAGQVITREDIAFLRTGTIGMISPMDYEQILGMKASRALTTHDVISWRELEPGDDPA